MRAVITRLGPGACLAIVAYLLLTLSGTTLSSSGISYLRENPSDGEGLQLGFPRVIRGDEWLVNTPTLLGRLASGSGTADSPLATSPAIVYQLPGSHVGESIMFFDGNLLRLGGILPQSMLFAAYFWLPWLMLALAMPAWLRRLGVANHLAWLATALTIVAPASAWWSFTPVRILGFSAAACWLLTEASDRLRTGRRRSAIVSAAVAGILIARLGTLYVPWSITIGIPIVLATAAWMLWPKADRRAQFLLCLLAGGVAVGLFGWVILENFAAFKSEVNAVYPGRRRSSGEFNGPAAMFGAPLYGYLQTGKPPLGTNQSELSSAFTIAGAWALVVWAGTAQRARDRAGAALAVIAASAGVWLVWSMVTLGQVGLRVPLLNLVPGFRAAQTVGFLLVIVLVIVLSRVTAGIPRRIMIAAAVVVGLLTAYGGSAMRANLPSLGTPYVVTASVALAVLAFLIMRFPRSTWPAWLLAAAALAQVIIVNPVLVGFGDLRDSHTARVVAALRAPAVHDDSLWVSDSPYTDALFIANGVPLLSGRQVTGADPEAWRKLDPSSQFEESWNRGSSTIQFGWTDDPKPVIGLYLSQDHILVNVNPCSLRGLGFNVAGIASVDPVAQSCLIPRDELLWGGKPLYLYDIADG